MFSRGSGRKLVAWNGLNCWMCSKITTKTLELRQMICLYCKHALHIYERCSGQYYDIIWLFKFLTGVLRRVCDDENPFQWTPLKMMLNPLSSNPTKWWNTLKQFAGKLPTNCLNVWPFYGIALKGLTSFVSQPFYESSSQLSSSSTRCFYFWLWICIYLLSQRRKVSVKHLWWSFCENSERL